MVLSSLEGFSDNNGEVPAFYSARVIDLSAGAFYNISLAVSTQMKAKSEWGWIWLVIAISLAGHSLCLESCWCLCSVLCLMSDGQHCPLHSWEASLGCVCVSSAPSIPFFFTCVSSDQIFAYKTNLVQYHVLRDLLFVQICSFSSAPASFVGIHTWSPLSAGWDTLSFFPYSPLILHKIEACWIPPAFIPCSTDRPGDAVSLCVFSTLIRHLFFS